MKLSKDLKTIYLFAIVSSIILIVGWGVLNTPDSVTYISAWDNYSNGKLDMLRTPIYPVYLGILKMIFGDNFFCYVAIIIQHVVFLISIRYFYRLAQSIIHSEQVSFWLTLFYSLMPPITTWNNYILTESFAISGTIFLVYLTIQFLEKLSVSILTIYAMILTVLVLLRPALIYMLPVFVVFWVYCLFIKRTKVGFCGISGVLIATICLLSYMKAFEKEYGIFASSSVNTVNQTHISRQYGLLNPEVVKDPELRADIIKSYEEYGREMEDYELAGREAGRLFKNYDLKTKNEVIYASYMSNPTNWLKKCFGRLYRSVKKSLFLTLAGGFATFFDMIGFNLNTLYLFIIIYSFILFCWMIKKHDVPYISILLYMLGVSNIIVAIIGAQGEWERLILPSMPIYLLLFGQLCTMFKVKSPLSIEFM